MAIYLDIVLNAFTPFWILTPTLQKKKKKKKKKKMCSLNLHF